jgi:hydrogenase nickel incorporation protein HypA/HybF
LTEVGALLRCRGCGHEWSPDVPVFRCGGCGGADVEVASGEELCVDYIEVEETEAACTAPR